MGIDYDVVLFYGWVFDYDTFKDMMIPFAKKIGLEVKEDPRNDYCFIELVEEIGSRIQNDHPYIMIGKTSPYYDCEITDYVFYISLGNDNRDIRKLILNPEIVSGHSLLQELNLHDPMIDALINVT